MATEYKNKRTTSPPLLPRTGKQLLPETQTGVLHEYGLGVPKDQHRAAEWHALAAKQGLGESHYHLGLMKAHGRGSSQDFSSAVIHFQKVRRLLYDVM